MSTPEVEQKMQNLNVKQEKPANKAEKKPKKAKATSSDGPSHPLEFTPKPEYFDHRIEMFDRLKAEYDEEIKSTNSEILDYMMVLIWIGSYLYPFSHL
jgi:threonyl-tRNA synthetase